MNQNTTEPVATAETLAEVPEHVLRGLPEEVRLFPSAVDKARIGVWATKPILKGKKFGPFVGDKKKRSQVKNNVYMWEVYYPNLGWMCIDATDPEKGNWLRYVNWACSGEEQNLFPLEINRAIYYKTLKVRVLELVSVTLHAFLQIPSLAVTDSNNFADFERIIFESGSSTH
ncbi:PREDICTED: PR domain zinc finger protein 2-like [Myotis brandtii]|uniref:PR domain zinc finger protein 2-like n=1 Tax=Myotis brandtii TaxID=109478 RepID=UPI000703FD41|nr:PREDICTED: PR domain zinc finger protein 2-like [Myotis brandtii]